MHPHRKSVAAFGALALAALTSPACSDRASSPSTSVDDPGARISQHDTTPASPFAGASSEETPLDWGAVHRDPRSPRFSIAVLPDIQYLFDSDRSDPAPVDATFRYLLAPEAAGRGEPNILFMAQLGDVTENHADSEFALASQSFRAIDGRVPYSVLAGNHDVSSRTDDQRGPTAYLAMFGPQRFQHDPTFGGASPDGYNSYHVFTGADRRWIVLALDWRISDGGIAWAQSVLDANPTTPVIVTTHELAYADSTGVASLSAYGQRLWDQLIRRNDQIFLTINGHFWPPGRTVMQNDAGHDVYVHIANYQDRYYGGSGMLRLYGFDLARGRIDVQTFSPFMLGKSPERRNPLDRLEVELTDDANRFSISMDFAARFAGFAPVPPRPARPAPAVLVPGTVAYWRFDASAVDGVPVPTGATFADLSGHGNYVTAARIGASGPSALTWSLDHHDDQPAHASLYFDGASGGHGGYLQTAAGAPINGLRFERGYTIEAFLKIQQGYDGGSHDWMGALSWAGQSGDAGKTGGDPLEPVSSLNVSPERFLQFIAYPVPRNDSSTNWSHAVATGTWAHVAVVSDGTLTVMYVQGSPITRNPRTPALGISTTGTPFIIGGTQYANVLDESFFGWIGDVRVVDRPLRVHEFMAGR
jgi:hypothetical protein